MCKFLHILGKILCNFWYFEAFALFCRKIAILPIYAFLCKILDPKNSGPVKVLTNIMSGSASSGSADLQKAEDTADISLRERDLLFGTK